MGVHALIGNCKGRKKEPHKKYKVKNRDRGMSR